MSSPAQQPQAKQNQEATADTVSAKKFLTGANQAEVRNRTGMVFWSLEHSIGNYIINLDPELEEWVRSRDVYFQHLVEKAYELTKGTSEGECFNELIGLLERYRIPEIRNALGHPLRGVRDNYWFRIASLATEPCVERLKLEEVRESLVAALEGRLTPPPVHWFFEAGSAVPNNLPRHAEHDITGFVGRDEDLKELRKLLSTPRTSSLGVVGIGGTGKTALVLSLLEQLSHDHETESWCEGILFVTAKRQQLTVDGVVELSSDESILGILTALHQGAEAIGCDHYFDQDPASKTAKHIIVCIDNFETVLSSDEMAISKLNEQLPEKAKLLLTSRITIDGVQTYSLRNMKKGDAQHLATTYAKRSGGVELPWEVVERIVKNLEGSPLAIKLAIDLYVRGDNEAVATGKARNDVISFSFTNLLERLDANEIKVLECLFVAGGPMVKADIMSILTEGDDVISSSLLRLSRTSLVKRFQSGQNDLYELPQTIRDLVRKNDTHVDVRKDIQALIKRHKKEIRFHEDLQKQWGLKPDSEYYLSPDLPSGLKHLLIQAIRILKSGNANGCGGWLSSADMIGPDFAEHPEFLYFKGRVLALAGDNSAACEALTSALSKSGDNPWYKLSLAEALLDEFEAESEQSALQTLQGLNVEKLSNSSDGALRRYWILSYKAYKAAGRWDDMANIAAASLEQHINAPAFEIHLENAGYALMSAVKHKHYPNPQESAQALIKAADYFHTLLNDHGMLEHQVRICVYFMKEVAFFAKASQSRPSCDVADLYQAVANLADALFERRLLVRDLYDMCVEQSVAISAIATQQFGEKSNPFFGLRLMPRPVNLAELSDSYIAGLYTAGQVLAVIRRINTLERGFAVAECIKTEATFFIHFNTGNLNNSEFKSLPPNTLVVIQPEPNPASGKPTAASWQKLSVKELSAS
jgi:hypothetical protein